MRIERDPVCTRIRLDGVNVGELRGIFIYSGDAHEESVMGSILMEDNRV